MKKFSLWVCALTVGASIGSLAIAAVPTDFAIDKDNASVVQSVAALHKGDVIEVHAFKAEKGTYATLSICDADCKEIHRVKRVSLYHDGLMGVTEKITLPQDGQILFWVETAPKADMNSAGAQNGAMAGQSQMDAVRTSFSGALAGDKEMAPIRKSEIDKDQIKVRYDHSSYVVISRASAAGN